MSQEKDNTLRRSLTMINGVTPTKPWLTATKKSPTAVSQGASMLTTEQEGGTLTAQAPHEDDANAVKYKFNVWNTLAMWQGELYVPNADLVSVNEMEITYEKFEELKISMRCIKEKTATVDFWNDLAKKEGRPYLEEKWRDNYSVQVSPYDQMLEACNEYDQHSSFEIDGKAYEDWGNIFEAREDTTITRLVFDKFIGLCDTIQLDAYGDLITHSPCADCGIGTNGSQLCGKTHCYHLNFRYRPNENCEWRMERHFHSGEDENFLPVIPTGFMCDVYIGGRWYRVHHPKQESPAKGRCEKPSEKFFFKEIRCRDALQDTLLDSSWKYFIVESTSLKSFIESKNMVEVERFSASKDKWVSCLKEIIDLTDDDDAQDQKLTKLPAPPSPKKGPMKPVVYEGSKGPLSTIDGPLHVTPKVTKTPSEAQSKKRSFYFKMGPAEIYASRVQSESWPYHCQCQFQFEPMRRRNIPLTVFQKEAIKRYKEKIADGSIYENANKLLDEWKGTEARIDPSLCTLDQYGYGKFYSGQVPRDTDEKELKLCTLAFFTALIDTVFGEEVQCECYDHPKVLLKDSLKRQINNNLNPASCTNIDFYVPLHVTPKVPKTPSKANSKKRKAFETPEKDGDKALVCPNAPQRKKQCPGERDMRSRVTGEVFKAACSPIVRQVFNNMGKDFFEMKQKHKALEEKVAKLTNLVHKLVGEKK